MPFPVPTGWSGPQQPDAFSTQPPQYILDAIGGSYDQSKYRWDPNSMSLVALDGSGSYGYGHIPDPSLGTDVVTNLSAYNADPSTAQHFAPGENPFIGFPDGGETFVSADPQAISDYKHDARTRNLQGIAQIGALVGGGALAGNFLNPATHASTATVSGSNAAAGATTYPLATGGTITGSAIPGVTSGTTAANAAAAGMGGAAASKIPDWIGNYLMPGLNAGLGIYGANQATNAMTDATDRAIAEEGRQFDLTRGDWQPWMDTGRDALKNLSDPQTNFLAGPNYEWVRSEGERNVGNSFAAKGGAASGNALRALTEFNSNLARGEYGDWYNRELARAGLGTTGTNAVTNARSNATGATSNYLAGQGVSRASGVLGRTNAVQNGLYDGYQNFLYRRRAA